jgi:hypothetical protein
MVLMRDGLWSIVNEDEIAPVEGNEAIRKFNIRRDKALSTIVMLVDSSLLYLLNDPVDPVVVWYTLADQFQKRTWANKLSLRRRLYNMKLKENHSVQEHIKTMTEIFQELSVIGDPIEEEDRVVHILASLPEEFDMLVTALESNKDVPDLETVTERIMHEERKLKEKSGSDKRSNPKALHVMGKPRRNQPQKFKGECWYCKEPGHKFEDCEEKVQDEKRDKMRKGPSWQRKGNNFSKEKVHLSERKKQDELQSSDSDYGFIVIGSHALSTVTENERKNWIVDSGATSHMCNNDQQFTELKKIEEPIKIKVGDGFSVMAEKQGTIDLKVAVDDTVKPCRLRNVLLVPELSYSLLSVSKATESKKKVEFDGNKCTITNKSGEVILSAKKQGNLYFANIRNVNREFVNSAEKKSPEIPKEESRDSDFKEESRDSEENPEIPKEESRDSEVEKECRDSKKNPEVSKEESRLWHSRYGHLGAKSLVTLAKNKMVSGFNFNKNFIKDDLQVCEPCVEGKHHHQKFPKDGGTRAKDPLGIVHTDICGKMDDVPSLGGKEYFLSIIDDKTRYTWTYPLKYKSDAFGKFKEWKAMAERSSGYKLKKLRSDNGGEYISNEFDQYLLDEGIQRQNSIPKTPQQNGVAERMNRTLEEVIRSMLSESKLPKRFWAEALATATYLRNRSPTKAVEDMTPFEAWNGVKPNVDHLRVFGSICYAHIHKSDRKKLDPKARKTILLGYGESVKGYRLYDPEWKRVFYCRDVIFKEMEFLHSRTENNVDNDADEPEVVQLDTASDDIQQLPENNEDNDTCEVTECPDEENEEAEASNQPVRSRRPPQYYGEWANHVTADILEPKDIKGVLKSDEKDKWLDAMENEIKSLKEHGVWDLVKLPEGRKTVGCKWIFKVKQDADGNVERYKARLVAQGFSQKEGEDYDETFSPVVRFESIRTVIALAAQLGLSLHQMDVKTAFLNGELKEKIYMRQPPGYVVQGKETYVCLLYKSLYGLKQSARCWNEELDSQLKKMGFFQSAFDPCIYVRSKENEIIIIAVYVDDLIIGGENDSNIKRIKDTISSKFDMEDMGKLHHFLGVKIVQNPSWIWIGQPAYIKVLLKNFSMDNSKAVATPFDAGTKLIKSKEDDDSCNKVKYQSAVGSLLFLSNRTRPDISYAVGVTARFSANPSVVHWSAVKRIMRYLNGSIDLGLLYVREEGTGKLVGYSDADWAGDLDDRKSTSGYVFQLSGSAITWRSKKQTVVALSTAEAEYIALASAAQEAVWLKRLISDLQGSEEKTITIYEDNQSAICMGKNQQYHGRTKHVDIKYHFVREKIATGAITVPYCKTDDMVADIFTKPLFAPRFKRMCELLGMKTLMNSDN